MHINDRGKVKNRGKVRQVFPMSTDPGDNRRKRRRRREGRRGIEREREQ